MASEVDGWTDMQIRDKFQELGAPVGPVTATTRKIMLKRLKVLMENGGNPITKPHEEEPFDEDDEPDAPPITRTPRRLGRSALAALNESQNIHVSQSPSLSPSRKQQFTPTRLSQNDEQSTFQGRQLQGNTSSFNLEPREDSPLPVRKTTPSRKAADTPIPSDTKRASFLGNSEHRSLTDARKLINDTESIGNEAFRSRLQGSATNFESNFMKKLCTPPRKYTYDLNDDMLSDDEETISSPVKFIRGNLNYGYEVRCGNEKKSIPSALLFSFLILVFAMAVIFFTAFYVNSHIEDTIPDLFYPVCSGSPADVPSHTCLEDADRAPVTTLLRAFNKGLADIRSHAPCTTSISQPIFVEDFNVKQLILKTNNQIMEWVVDKKLIEMKVLINANPSLNLKSEAQGISLIKGPDTFLCFALQKVLFLAEWIIKICITAIVGSLLIIGVYLYNGNRKKSKDEDNFAFEKLVDLVQTRKCVTFDEARRELSSSGFTARAIANGLLLAADDTRLKIESGKASEEIRWVASNGSHILKSPWDQQVSNVRVGCVTPPTSCLKIRGMFSPYKITCEEDIMTIVDAILEKCIGNRIVHAVVDRKSSDGIVYLRGMTKADAGGIFRRLDGLLYCGSRVSVKFLKEAQYDRKFPDSSKYTLPIRPSNSN